MPTIESPGLSPTSSWPRWPSGPPRPRQLRRLPEATARGPGGDRVHRSAGAARYGGRQARFPRPAGPGPADGPRLHLQRLDDRLLRTAQLDAGAVRRAGPARRPSAPARSWRPHRWHRPAAACPPRAVSGSPGGGPGRPGPITATGSSWRRCAAPTTPSTPRSALLPAGDVTVEDVWHTDGMRATGSNDAIATDVVRPRAPAW